ncbi:MAG: hypothetical protein AB1567_03180 [bacterium]
MNTDNITEILEKIERAFEIKAESHLPEEISAYFARREDILISLKQPKHQILVGRKGTGKTMMLKYMSLPIQIHYNKTDPEFRGFYIKLSTSPSIKFDPENDPNIVMLFGHWFNLYTSWTLLNTVKIMYEHDVFNVSIQIWSFVNFL